MDYLNMTLSGFLKNVVAKDGKGKLPQKFCFLLGAGASRSSGIPAGQEMVESWEADLADMFSNHEAWKKKLGITETNRASFYSEYYDRRYGHAPSSGYNYLEKQMEKVSPSIGYIILSGLMVMLPQQVVITTNFDHLLERAFNDYTTEMPQVIGHEALAHYALQPTTRPRILKIHRDLLLAPKSSKEGTDKLEDAWGRVLDHVFREYSPIVIGYAGNDKSVMNFLTENAEKFRDNTWQCPYWMVYRDEKPNQRVENFLTEAGGVLISTDGFDDVMVQMGSVLGYTLPRRDPFVAQAAARYDTISKQYQELQKKIAEREKNENRDATEVENAMADIYPPPPEDASDEEKAAYYADQGQKLWLDKLYEEAEPAFREAIRLQANDPETHYWLASCLEELNRPLEAEPEYREAIRLAPANSWYHRQFARYLSAQNRAEEAEREFRETIRLEPSSASGHLYLANFLLHENRLAEAEEELAIAKKLGWT